mmetsp:Transcript_105402/g.314819  ORF Transcript_105402/g.314819 Transcript_105402/m.314819 type:complete len:299 (-) Transcript_105402:2177-3073(-)
MDGLLLSKAVGAPSPRPLHLHRGSRLHAQRQLTEHSRWTSTAGCKGVRVDRRASLYGVQGKWARTRRGDHLGPSQRARKWGQVLAGLRQCRTEECPPETQPGRWLCHLALLRHVRHLLASRGQCFVRECGGVRGGLQQDCHCLGRTVMGPRSSDFSSSMLRLLLASWCLLASRGQCFVRECGGVRGGLQQDCHCLGRTVMGPRSSDFASSTLRLLRGPKLNRRQLRSAPRLHHLLARRGRGLVGEGECIRGGLQQDRPCLRRAIMRPCATATESSHLLFQLQGVIRRVGHGSHSVRGL